jgi:ABC-type transport system involved in Fe-S cluster assembly fused permease/ATPase subunit
MHKRLISGLKSLFEVVALVWREASRFVKVRLAVVLLLVITASVLMALGPIALKLVVDGFTGQTKGAAVSPLVLIGLYVLSQWLSRSVGEVRGLVYARAERRMLRALSERLFAHLLQLPLRFHLERQTGAVSQTLDNGLQGYQMILHHLVFTCLPVVAELGTIILVLIRLDRPVFLALFCGALVCYAVVFAYAATTNANAAKSAAAAHIASSAAMLDGLMNYEAVKYFTAESLVQDKVSQALSRTEVEWVGFYRRYALNGLGVATIFAGFLGATILFAAHEVEGARMTVGDFVLVNTYMLQVVRPMEMLGYAMQGLSQGVAMLEKMLGLFRERPEPLSLDDRESLEGPGKLEFENVGLGYRPDQSVLKGISFWIPAGKTLGIVGASGSGKSTLVRLITRLLEPDDGRILLDGERISTLPLAKLRRAIAVVPQETVLFDDTIAYNIGFGKEEASREDIEQAAKVAHLHDFIMSLPEQYDTRVGERGVKLSGGEKQRVSIARAAIKRPRIYVFDEATSSLDSRTEGEILRNLQEISRFSTTLVIAHRLSTVVHADEIVVLDGGALVERGTHASLLRQNGRYAALWHAQQHGAVAA